MSKTNTQTDIARYEQPSQLSRDRYEPRDLDQLKSYAQLVVKSGLCPSHIKGPADALLIMQRGAEMGITAVNALQNMYVINGKASMSAQLAVGVCKASPLCRYFQCVEYESDRVTWETHRVGNPNPTRVTFTKEDAQRAGLWGREMWSKYPQNMMSARASINLARMEYSDLLAGIYTPDELGSDSPDVVQAPTVEDAPRPGARDEADILDAEFEEAPAAPAPAQPRSMRADSHTKQFDEYAAINAHERAEREKAKAKEEWKRHNAAIHAQLAGLDEAWLRAFHDFITNAFKVDQWNDLSAEQLGKTRQRLDGQKSAVAWVKETCGEFLPAQAPAEAPRADGTSKGWGEVSKLIHEVTGKDSDRFHDCVEGIYAKYDVDAFMMLSTDQLREIWRDLSARSADVPNGGAGGEVSEREIWLAELAEMARVSRSFDDGDIPF